MFSPFKRLWVIGVTAVGLVSALVVVPATAAHSSTHHHHHHHRPIVVSVITPTGRGAAGANGTFNVDVELQARTRSDNNRLSPNRGYRPFLNLPDQDTFGPGLPDPGAPGLVVLLSTTPAAAGGPNTNLAGVFQLNAVEKVNHLRTTFNDWQVGVPGFFGRDVNATLTVFVVAGTAPGHVDMSRVHPISNIAHVHFHIA
jgi:hypothetical protein